VILTRSTCRQTCDVAGSAHTGAPTIEPGTESPGRHGVVRIALVRTAACLAVASLIGCAGLGKQSTQPNLQPWPEIERHLQVEALRARMYEYSITFAAEVDLAAVAIERQAADSTVRRNATLWRVRAIPEMRKACFRLEPVSALIDGWILARQMDQLFREGAGAGAFGALQPEAVEVSRRLLDQIREIGGSITVTPAARATFEHRIIDPWSAEHPLRDLTFVRESPIARFAEQSRARGDTLQSVATMEDLALSLSQQARIFLAELPRQIRAEFDLIRSDVLATERVASIESDLHLSATAADRIAVTAEGVSSLVANEREIVLTEMSRQRSLVMEAVSLERERVVAAMIRAFATERRELLRNLESQRRATLDWATAERRETVAEVRRELAVSMEALRGERAIIVEDLRHIVDAVVLRVAIFLISAVVLAPLVAHAYARVWPRRRRDL
jgi:hypothetical protein